MGWGGGRRLTGITQTAGGEQKSQLWPVSLVRPHALPDSPSPYTLLTTPLGRRTCGAFAWMLSSPCRSRISLGNVPFIFPLHMLAPLKGAPPVPGSQVPASTAASGCCLPFACPTPGCWCGKDKGDFLGESHRATGFCLAHEDPGPGNPEPHVAVGSLGRARGRGGRGTG